MIAFLDGASVCLTLGLMVLIIIGESRFTCITHSSVLSKFLKGREGLFRVLGVGGVENTS